MTKKLISLTILLLAFACSWAQERIIVVNEGRWESDDGQLAFIDGSTITNQWFRKQNAKMKLGDTPNDIIHLKDNLIAISVNYSNIIQYITTDGKDCGATENVPNNRKLATDGTYLYVTSYAHSTALNEKYTKGYVAKIDIETKNVVKTCEVGYEPEGIVFYKGKLFIANSGGYAPFENHGHETTVSVVDAETLQKITDIDTGCINLYGGMAISGQYLCINSAGNHQTIEPKTIIMNCDDYSFVTHDFSSTLACTHNGLFYCIGSNEMTGEVTTKVIDPASNTVTDGINIGSVNSDIMAMNAPYGIYINPYTGYIYVSDAKNYDEAGEVYQYNASGVLQNKFKTYINPAHFLALPPDGTGISIATTDDNDEVYYNLQGIKTSPSKGRIYIHKGKKVVY
ncbi:MAG: hypothetical protein IKX93_01735 [Bacteroidaceae bacterium]|nr:hypothetical protein [Bacteroidaceae bacterium]